MCIQAQGAAATWDLAPGRQMPPGLAFDCLHREEGEEKEFRALGRKFLQ